LAEIRTVVVNGFLRRHGRLLPRAYPSPSSKIQGSGRVGRGRNGKCQRVASVCPR